MVIQNQSSYQRNFNFVWLLNGLYKLLEYTKIYTFYTQKNFKFVKFNNQPNLLSTNIKKN